MNEDPFDPFGIDRKSSRPPEPIPRAVRRGMRASALILSVPVLVLVLVAQGSPSLFRSQPPHATQIASGTLRILYHAQLAFLAAGIRQQNGINQYGTLEELASQSPPFIDEALASGEKAGYVYELEVFEDNPPGFVVYAYPIQDTEHVFVRLRVDHTGVLRATADGSLPTENSPDISKSGIPREALQLADIVRVLIRMVPLAFVFGWFAFLIFVLRISPARFALPAIVWFPILLLLFLYAVR